MVKHWIKTHKNIVKIILITVIFIEATVFAFLSGNKFRYSDERDYYHLAIIIISDKGYVGNDMQPTAYRPPGYPYFLSLIFRISKKPISAKLANAIFLLFTALVLSFVVRGISGTGDVVSLFLLSCYPLFPYTSVAFHK